MWKLSVKVKRKKRYALVTPFWYYISCRTCISLWGLHLKQMWRVKWLLVSIYNESKHKFPFQVKRIPNKSYPIWLYTVGLSFVTQVCISWGRVSLVWTQDISQTADFMLFISLLTFLTRFMGRVSVPSSCQGQFAFREDSLLETFLEFIVSTMLVLLIICLL